MISSVALQITDNGVVDLGHDRKGSMQGNQMGGCCNRSSGKPGHEQRELRQTRV